MKARGFRALQAVTLCRPWRRPLFGRTPPFTETGLSGITVWTDDVYEVGALLNLDVLSPGAPNLSLTARVAMAERQPEGAPAVFLLGLVILRFREGAWEALEPLLAP